MRMVGLERIDELAVKAKIVGLTDLELAKRDKLRKIYWQKICGQVLSSLLAVTLVDEQGKM